MRLINLLKNVVLQPSETTSDSPSIDPDYAYMILSNERRRRAVEFLSEFGVGDRVPVGDIADNISDGDRKACYISLIQCQLVKMENARNDGMGVVDYDERSKTVTVREELHVLHRAHVGVQSVID
jgi:hypothetical protein